MEQEGQASNPPTGGSTKPEKDTPQQQTTPVVTFPSSEILPIWRPEHLSIGSIGMVHNGCILVILFYCFTYALSGLKKPDVTATTTNSTTMSTSTTDGRMTPTEGQLIWLSVLSFIGLIIASVASRMDTLLRYSTDPAMDRIEVANILQKYVIVNLIFELYGLIMFVFLSLINFIPPEYKYTFIGMMIGSLCVRMVCAEIVERYLILLVQVAGIKPCCRCCCPGFFLPSKQAQVQPGPPNQEQQV